MGSRVGVVEWSRVVGNGGKSAGGKIGLEMNSIFLALPTATALNFSRLRHASRFWDSTDECMQLKKQIEELVRAEKLSHLIKEIKQGRDQSKTGKKETTVKDKPTTICMIRSWQRTIKQKVVQSFEQAKEIMFPPLAANNRTKGPLVIEAEIGGHMIRLMYIDGGSLMKILYEHCFNRLRPEIKSQMIPAATSLTGFSGETIWPLGQLRLLVIIGDATHSTKAWMNFMVVKSLSPYNGIIGRPGLKAIQAVSSTVYGMFKFPVEGGIVTICSTVSIPTKYTSVITSPVIPREEKTRPANFKIALHPDFPYQEVVIGGTLSDKGRTKLCSVLRKKLDIFAWQPSDMTECHGPLQNTDSTSEKGIHRCNKRKGVRPLNAPRPYMRKSKTGRGRNHERSLLPRLAVQPSHAKETRWQLADVCRFHGSEQGLSARLLPLVGNRLESGVSLWLPLQVLLRCLQMLPPIIVGGIKQRKDSLPYRAGGQIGRNIEVYVDYLVVKSHTEAEMMRDVEETFRTLRKRAEFTYALRLLFTASNNEDEYEALVAGLRIAARMGVRNVQVSVDFKLVANQVLGTYVAKEDNMIKYLEIVKGLVSGFTTFSISQVPRSKNKKAYALSKIASTSFAHLSKHVLVEVLENKSIKEKEVATVIEEDGATWMTQRSFLTPWLRCMGPLQAEYVMRETHEGSCSMQAGPHSVVAKAIRLGYYRPTMHKDARDMIRKCSDCQWIEAKAVATITGGHVKKFVWDNIVCRFGIPGEIISDNGKQFSDNPFKDWCDKLNITLRFASVKHPQSNGLVKRANRSLGEGIKSRLREGNKNWVEELPHVLWAHQTMIKSSHGDMPFSLTYGTEAVIPTEIGMPTYHTANVDVVNNDEELRLNLDLLDDRLERVTICEAKAKSKMMKYYNARVRGVAFKPGEFVYRNNDASYAVAGGKLGPK
uniref:Reverse transcriptase domain-containing protein n=1 Tax=Tanacetum cinerariifolium TaxID=118510 RepID=A0A6L2J333_TANCI|nr:reverse transcriptase domain-containing protein [Tanacetum cinerariifolium]